MEQKVEIIRDGLTLRGRIFKPEVKKCPVVIMFHGLLGSSSDDVDNHQFYEITNELLKHNIASIKFDFNGHGISDGKFSDMTILGELLDAAKIIEYTKSLDFTEDIYLLGHSMGGVVAGMMAGYYTDIVKKLVMLAPAATMVDDANRGSCFGTAFDPVNVPDYIIPWENDNNSKAWGFMFRVNKTLPVYETTKLFRGKTLIIHGTNDDAVGVIGAKRYREHMPQNTEVVLIENEIHSLDAFAFDEVRERVVTFLAED
ncbi:MAG: alpha/beta hydrolase [Clostridia bacterium]|nr:alpha/beta hydrolase [Clostridia bacterium]